MDYDRNRTDKTRRLAAGRFLEWAKIDFAGFLIDKTYFENSPEEIAGHAVFLFDEIVKKEKCNIIVGFRGFDKNRIGELKTNTMIENIYLLDFVGRCILDDQIPYPINQTWIKENEIALDEFYNSLADDKSRKSLDDFISQKITGIPAKEYEPSQYFADDIISLTDGEAFINCGTFHGETSLKFVELMEQKGFENYSLISFEPDYENAKIAEKNLESVKNSTVEICGVYNADTTLYFRSGNESNSTVSKDGDIEIKVRAIDNVLNGKKATFIKMDIEGSELEALQGAEKTIREYKPKLAICIYHKRDDLIKIPQFIKSMRPDYKLYVRNHWETATETVLYAV